MQKNMAAREYFFITLKPEYTKGDKNKMRGQAAGDNIPLRDESPADANEGQNSYLIPATNCVSVFFLSAAGSEL